MNDAIETLHVEPWSSRWTFSPATSAGGFIFVSGLTATDDTGAIVGPGDFEAQTRHIFRKIERILATKGAGLGDIVETVDYVTTLEGYGASARVRREIFGDRFPAATGVVVSALVRPEALIEIKATAYVGMR